MSDRNVATDGANAGADQNQQPNQQGQEPRSYTQDELNALLQAEADKRVTEALKTAQAKWQADQDTAIKNARSEAEKLAKMSADQRADAERQKQQDELTKREADITKRELMATAKDALLTKGLPIELADTLNYADADSCNKSLEAVEKAFNIAVEKAVNTRLQTPPPKDGDTPPAVTNEQFNKMSYAERVDLYKKDLKAYEKLSGGSE